MELLKSNLFHLINGGHQFFRNDLLHYEMQIQRQINGSALPEDSRTESQQNSYSLQEPKVEFPRSSPLLQSSGQLFPRTEIQGR